MPLALVLAACGSHKTAQQLDAESASRIVSGTSVSKDEAVGRSTVALVIQTKSGGQSTCTGTLIDTHVVLTAAHCFLADETDPVEYVMVAFANSFSEIGADNVRGVEDAIIHPGFGPKAKGQGTWNDAALLKFAGDLPAGYKAVPYLKDLTKLHKGLAMTIAGFGLTSPAGDDAKPDEISIGNLLKASVKLTDPSHEGGELLTDTKENSASTCKGDSGGPAYAEIDGQLTVVGITSRGSNQRCDNVSIFTSTAFQTTFISEALQTLKAP